ncbi:MAG: hypothetical protein JNM88_02725 [Chitinophagaceae bacterium]|nr:hypothetical protein [Chitinophagaceae bacterium]
MLKRLQQHSIKILLFSAALLCMAITAQAQKRTKPVVSLSDTAAPATPKTPMNRYDSAMLAHSPKKAAFRSAVLPGWGQIYNKKYWKLPIVYGALGTCAVVFTYNLKWYRRTRYAYAVLYTKDVANYGNVNPKLKVFVDNNQLETLRYYRNQYRRDIDYSALFFLLLWGLNVVDATVDAHLKSFDVSPDLSLHFKPGYSELAKTNGLSIVLKIGK